MSQIKMINPNKKKINGIFLSIQQTFSASPVEASLYCVMKALYGILPAVYVVLYARFIDGILLFYADNLSLNAVLWNAAPVVLVIIFQYCSGNLTSYFELKCMMRTNHRESLKMMDKCSRIPYVKIEDSEFRDLMYNVEQGLGKYVFGGLHNVLGLLELLLNMMGILWVIFLYSWVAALIVLVCFVPMIMVSMRSGKEDYAAFERYGAAERRMNSYEEMLTSEKYADERIVFGYAGWVADRWKKKFDEAADIFLDIKKKSYTRVKVTSVLIKIILLAVMGLLIYMAVSGSVSLGTCTMLITQILAMSSRLTWNFSAYLHQIFSTKSYMKNYITFYAAPDMPEKKVHIDKAEKIEFIDVSFRYGEELPFVLKNLSFCLESGVTYALVGENGAGKTTIMKLLLGLYDSYEGSILINGIELREIANLNEMFSAMFQDFAKYEISIRDNIYLTEESAETDKKEQDRELLKLMEKIKLDLSDMKAAEGFDTQIGRLGGENRDLSGGQWQRLAMLRALVHPGVFFLLDEPTSALDPMAESAVYRDFKEMTKGRSALLITHRLGAARLSDKILVLQDGRMAEQGTHEELLAMGGIYSLMFEGQKGWYEDEET